MTGDDRTFALRLSPTVDSGAARSVSGLASPPWARVPGSDLSMVRRPSGIPRPVGHFESKGMRRARLGSVRPATARRPSRRRLRPARPLLGAAIVTLVLIRLLPNPYLASSSDAATVAPATPAAGASPADGQPASVARAMRAGVLIESVRSGSRSAFASGVVLRLRRGRALIVTAQHVVNPAFSRVEQPPDVGTLTGVSVTTSDGTRTTARVEWLAPHGIDLAIVSAPVAAKQVREAPWDASARPAAGAALFAIGNPGDGRWVRSDGTLARIRDVEQDGFAFALLQTTVPVLPGDSGGGLYEAGGRLIGVTSMRAVTSDPHSPGDVGFAQALATLLQLAPRRLGLPARNP